MFSTKNRTAILAEFCRFLGIHPTRIKFENTRAGASGGSVVFIGKSVLDEGLGLEVVRFGICVMRLDWELSSLPQLLRVIAHEMIHARQFLDERLVPVAAGGTIFEGVRYPKHLSYSDYWNAPWELEAREGELRLVDAFLAEADPRVVRSIRSHALFKEPDENRTIYRELDEKFLTDRSVST